MHEARKQNCRRKAVVSLAHLMACEIKECIMQTLAGICMHSPAAQHCQALSQLLTGATQGGLDH